MPSPKRGKQHKTQDDAPFNDMDEIKKQGNSDSPKIQKGKSQPELVKGPWSKAEDELLIQLVEEYGAKDWSKIAAAMAKRGQVRMGKQCRERYNNTTQHNTTYTDTRCPSVILALTLFLYFC